jgi:protein-S-isoprenylcysteine O-methyltransferase Ste14
VAPPPLIFFDALVLGVILQLVWPRRLFGVLWMRIVSACLIVGGLALSGAVVRHFGRAETPVTPWRETQRLVVSGPYRVSRNPDYVGQAMLTAGLGLVLAAPWVIAALVPALLVVRYGVIAREERYLARRFGDEYARYRDRVRRWL